MLGIPVAQKHSFFGSTESFVYNRVHAGIEKFTEASKMPVKLDLHKNGGHSVSIRYKCTRVPRPDLAALCIRSRGHSDISIY